MRNTILVSETSCLKVRINLRRVVVKTSSGDVYFIGTRPGQFEARRIPDIRTFRVNQCLDISDETRSLTESSSGLYLQYRKYFRARFHLSHFLFFHDSQFVEHVLTLACIYFEVINARQFTLSLRSIEKLFKKEFILN